jgi:hypothetical protein
MEVPYCDSHKNKDLSVDESCRRNAKYDNSTSEQMPLHYHYEDLESSPFDEPPMRAELDFDRLVYDMKRGFPAPSRLLATYVVPSSSKRCHTEECSNADDANDEFDVDEDDDGASRPHDESRYQHEHHRYPADTRRRSIPSDRANRPSSFRNNRSSSKRLTFAKQLVDIVPEQWLFRQDGNSFSVVSSRFGEEDEDDDDVDDDDDEFEEDEDSLVSQENSLEYFLRGEWIQDEDLLAPLNCKSSRHRNYHNRSIESPNTAKSNYLCGFDGKATCLSILYPAHFSSKPFSVPLKWKEYTSLDSECLSASFCRSESCLQTIKRSAKRTESACSEGMGTEEVEEETAVTRAASGNTSFRDILPLLSLQVVFGKMFEQPPSDATNKTSKQSVRNSQMIATDSDSLSLSNTNVSDSEDSTLANINGLLIVRATAE